MYRSYDMENGLPPRIYRSVDEIRRDISRINERIDETNDMLNIRSLLLDMLIGDGRTPPEELIPELELAIDDAKRALLSLSEFKEELSLLEEELNETKCMIGG